MRNYLKLGDWNAVCDRCAFEFKASQLKEEWTGFRVCKECYEPRHPSDLIRAPRLESPPPWTRPEPAETYIQVPSYFVGDNLSGNAPHTVHFTDMSMGGPSTWSWNFGDATTSTSQNPTKTYSAAGTYTVTLDTDATTISTRTGYITVGAQLPSTWQYSVNVNTVTFESTVATATTWSWNFGDGNTSTQENPVHTYAILEATAYTVTLTTDTTTATAKSVETTPPPAMVRYKVVGHNGPAAYDAAVTASTYATGMGAINAFIARAVNLDPHQDGCTGPSSVTFVGPYLEPAGYGYPNMAPNNMERHYYWNPGGGCVQKTSSMQVHLQKDFY